MLAALMPRSIPASGRAMFTTETSSTIISWATAMTARASQRRGSGAVSTAGVVPDDVVPEAVVRLSAGMAELSFLRAAQWRRGWGRAGTDGRRRCAVVDRRSGEAGG